MCGYVTVLKSYFGKLPKSSFPLSLVSWETFHVWLAGRTNEAHYPIIEMLKRIGQTQVNSPEECDYLLVFCPVVSRVGTDITDALSNLPCKKYYMRLLSIE